MHKSKITEPRGRRQVDGLSEEAKLSDNERKRLSGVENEAKVKED
jgi:hypothetical protein